VAWLNWNWSLNRVFQGLIFYIDLVAAVIDSTKKRLPEGQKNRKYVVSEVNEFPGFL